MGDGLKKNWCQAGRAFKNGRASREAEGEGDGYDESSFFLDSKVSEWETASRELFLEQGGTWRGAGGRTSA